MKDYSRAFNPQLASEGSVWDKSSLYKTSTQSQNEKNVLAMNNSTEQLLKTKSKNLQSTSTNIDSVNKHIAVDDFQTYDHSNQYKTSYNLIDSMPNQRKGYFIPKYLGFVPGMKSENPFGTTFTQASIAQMQLFDKRQHNEAKELDKSTAYNPLSKAIGAYYNNGARYPIDHQPYDPTRSQSGYSINLLAKSPAGIICPSFIDPIESHKTEYRSHYQKNSFHYKCPLYSTGLLKPTQSKSYS